MSHHVSNIDKDSRSLFTAVLVLCLSLSMCLSAFGFGVAWAEPDDDLDSVVSTPGQGETASGNLESPAPVEEVFEDSHVLEPASDPATLAMAQSMSASLGSLLGELEADMSAFSSERAAFNNDVLTHRALPEQALEIQNRVAELEGQRTRASELSKTVREELELSSGPAGLVLLARAGSANDIQSRYEMLEWLLTSESDKANRAQGSQKALNASLAIDRAADRQQTRAAHEATRPVNQAAYRVERDASQVRQAIKDFQVFIDSTIESNALSASDRGSFYQEADAALVRVRQVEGEIGDWYDTTDAYSGTSGLISFGTGIDFSLPETEFVEKWGAAIDAYYEDKAKQGGHIPLGGYGKTMATSAYRHHVDPRLCAAVSIAESSGGQACIKPHNAWGWGAADSNPYALAASWTSFDEAIEAWHVGMETSTSGLATARTVSALGSIYCSSPQWGATVIEQMELIASHA